jgi:chorismate mutase
MKEIIESLKNRVDLEKEDSDEVSWQYGEGILISNNDAKKIINMDREFDIMVEYLTELYKYDINVPILQKMFNKINDDGKTKSS